MYNARIGFIDAGGLQKTTNGGQNWTPIPGAGAFLDMYFADSLTGWKCNLDMKKTTDGGLNWVSQTLPQGGMIITSGVYKFSNINRDTIWAVGGWVQYPNFQSRGLLYRTTNGGTNWLFQIPDTAYNIFYYNHTKFINKLTGWAYSGPRGIHTTTGGDPIFHTSVKQISSSVPKGFKLFNNYPNPFNPNTNIKYSIGISSGQIVNSSYVKLTIYDITGKEIKKLVDENQDTGVYEIVFDASGLASGIYFYSLFADGKLIDTKRMVLLK
jgi:photosystem II stability/assembly factor-like uncharacterized protein